MKKFLLLATLLVPMLALAQDPPVPTPVTVQVGADAHDGTPNGNLTILLGDKLKSYTTFDYRPTSVLGQLTYSIRTGVEYALFETPYLVVNVDGQGGIAQSPSTLSGILTGGINLGFKLSKLKGWTPIIGAEAIVSPADQTAPRAGLVVGIRKRLN